MGWSKSLLAHLVMKTRSFTLLAYSFCFSRGSGPQHITLLAMAN